MTTLNILNSKNEPLPKSRVFVFCSDVHNHYVYGTFFEALYHIAQTNRDANIIPLIICGDSYTENLLKVKHIIEDNLDNRAGSYTTHKDWLSQTEQEMIIDHLRSSNLASIDSANFKNYMYSGINIGTSIVSSIISKKRCISIEPFANRVEILSYTYYSILFLESFVRIIKSININKNDRIAIYNGRHYNTGPIANYCDKLGIKTSYYERTGYRSERVVELPNRVHDFYNNSLFLSSYYNEIKQEQDEEINNYFSSIKKNPFSSDNDCVKYRSKKPVITYFSSSEDEYASIDKKIHLSFLFRDQRDAVTWLCNWAESQEKYNLVIRIHPNQKHICARDLEFWTALKGKNITVIPSESTEDSYKLIENSEKVISFLSTIGIEATYMGKPSISLGNPIYSCFDATYNPKTSKELRRLIESKITPKPKSNLFPFVAYNQKFGREMSFYKKIKLSSFSDYKNIFNIYR